MRRHEDIDLDRTLDFARTLLANPARAWNNAPPENRLRLQRAIYPTGLRFSGRLSATAETPFAFRYLKAFGSGRERMASLAHPGWNRTHEWLSEMESLRQNLSMPLGSAPEVRLWPARA